MTVRKGGGGGPSKEVVETLRRGSNPTWQGQPVLVQFGFFYASGGGKKFS